MALSLDDEFGSRGTGSPVAKWLKLGSEVTGEIVSDPFVETFKDKKVIKFDVRTIKPVWVSASKVPDGAKVLDTCTTSYDGEQYENSLIDAGPVVACWLDSGWQINALRDAVAEAGARGIEKGGQVQVKHHELADKRPGDKGRAKKYKALYKAPAMALPLDDEEPF